MPDCDSKDAYIFTAKHGIKNSSDLSIHVIEDGSEITVCVKDVFFHEDQDIDAAVLVITNTISTTLPFSLLAMDGIASVYYAIGIIDVPGSKINDRCMSRIGVICLISSTVFLVSYTMIGFQDCYFLVYQLAD